MFGQDVYSPQGYIISECLNNFGDNNFELVDMQNMIDDDTLWMRVPEQSRTSLNYKIGNYINSGLFSSQNGIKVRIFFKKSFVMFFC